MDRLITLPACRLLFLELGWHASVTKRESKFTNPMKGVLICFVFAAHLPEYWRVISFYDFPKFKYLSQRSLISCYFLRLVIRVASSGTEHCPGRLRSLITTRITMSRSRNKLFMKLGIKYHVYFETQVFIRSW